MRAEDNDMKWSREQLASLLLAVPLVIMVVVTTLVTETTDITIIYYYYYLLLFIYDYVLFAYFRCIACHAVLSFLRKR